MSSFDVRRRAQPNGWWGMALFLCSEITIFGTMLGTYWYLKFQVRHWPPPGVPEPELVLPLIATTVLAATSLPMALAVRAGRRGERGRVLTLITGATVVQCLYLALQILLLRHDLRSFSPQGSAYGSIYFTLLVTHHTHVALGIALNLTVLLFVAVRGLDNYWLIGVRGLALYWYVVAVVGIIVTLVQVSPSL